MRFRFLISVGSVVLLTACSQTPFHSRSDEYLKETGSIPPIQSTPAARIKTGPNYFPYVPIDNLPLARQTPSLVPPGSNLQRFKAQATPAANQAAQAQKTVVQSQVPRQMNSTPAVNSTVQAPAPATSGVKLQSKNGVTALMIASTVDQVWNSIPRVLASTPYHILDQNQARATYFVLDTTQTNGQITQATPVYRMQIAPLSPTSSILRLFNRDGTAADPKVSKQILSALAQNWGN